MPPPGKPGAGAPGICGDPGAPGIPNPLSCDGPGMVQPTTIKLGAQSSRLTQRFTVSLDLSIIDRFMAQGLSLLGHRVTRVDRQTQMTASTKVSLAA